MSFESISHKFFGMGYIGEAYTVQDLEVDPSGNCIYAEGEITINHPSRVSGGGRQSKVQLNNRGFRNVDGKKSYTPPLYTINQSKECLVHLVHKLRQIGRQG